jgi:site-specific DNA recombinase
VNAILTEQAKNNKQPLNKKTHLFTGFVTCVCGTKMYLPSNNPKYTCQKCKNKIPEETLEEIFYTKLQEYTIYKENIESYIVANNNTMSEKEVLLKTIQKEAQKIQIKLDNLIELHLNKEMPTEGFKHHYNPLFEQLQQIQTQIPQIEGEILALKQNEENSKYIFSEAESLFSKWNTLTKDQKRNIIESITDSIIIDTEEVTINLKYLMPPSPLNPTDGHHNFMGS